MSFDLSSRLAARRAEHLFRQRPLLQSPQSPEVVVDGQPLLAFCSNDYLGLASHPEVIRALQQGAQKWGVGGGASHLVVGHSQPHHELEEALAEFTGRPRALLFSTGYMANLAAVTALVGQGDSVLEDRLNHASLLDAGLLNGDCLTVTGRTVAENLKDVAPYPADQDVVRPLSNPIKKDSHLRILYGNLAPEGAVAIFTAAGSRPRALASSRPATSAGVCDRLEFPVVGWMRPASIITDSIGAMSPLSTSAGSQP